ncbi:MAG: GTPase ObgE [Fibrobacteria bacterium]|nr:GTPase ObgE [Fibrobacteria bacterium]
MFLDETYLELRSGKGGDGSKSFQRRKHMPRGGPDGGDGGRGGHIILKANSNFHTLYDIDRNHFIKTENGVPGGPFRNKGKNGADIIVEVPCGTVIKSSDTVDTIYSLDKHGETWVAARGGSGGKGNYNFKSSTNQAPDFFTPGKPGEYKKIFLELKLIADCGLVGHPNAGKSFLINRLSNATPKIANYAFTTMKPYLGVVDTHTISAIPSFVLADIPGLIEGAAAGKGLGNQFLRHIERTACLAFVIDISLGKPWEEYQALLHELKTYQKAMLEKPRLILLNKCDLGEFTIPKEFNQAGCTVILSSALAGTGLDDFKKEVTRLIKPEEEISGSDW